MLQVVSYGYLACFLVVFFSVEALSGSGWFSVRVVVCLAIFDLYALVVEAGSQMGL